MDLTLSLSFLLFIQLMDFASRLLRAIIKFVLSNFRSGAVDAPSSQDYFRAVAWALSNETPLDPLIVCSRGRILYVLNAKQKSIVGQLRGHGGVKYPIAREAASVL